MVGHKSVPSEVQTRIANTIEKRLNRVDDVYEVMFKKRDVTPGTRAVIAINPLVYAGTDNEVVKSWVEGTNPYMYNGTAYCVHVENIDMPNRSSDYYTVSFYIRPQGYNE